MKKSHPVLVVIGWIAIVFGALIALASLFVGDGFGGKIGGVLIGVAFAVLGALLIGRINWKAGVPGAVVALLAGGAISPSPEPAPVVSPAPSSVVSTTMWRPTTSSNAPVTTTTSSSVPSSSSITTTTTVPPTTTTTIGSVPGITETDTRTPVPVPAVPTVDRTTTRTAPAAPAVGRYSSCAEARAAGAAPLYPSSPGWNPKLDRNKNGVACEDD